MLNLVGWPGGRLPVGTCVDVGFDKCGWVVYDAVVLPSLLDVRRRARPCLRVGATGTWRTRRGRMANKTFWRIGRWDVGEEKGSLAMSYDDGVVGAFFDALWGAEGDGEGVSVWVASGTPRLKRAGKVDHPDFRDEVFEWPRRREGVLRWVERYRGYKDLWACVHPYPLGSKRRADWSYGEDGGVMPPVRVVWADLDPCPLGSLRVAPSIGVESSPGLSQAFWVLSEPVSLKRAAGLARAVYRAHAGEGCDKGWAPTRVMRIPGTRNYKRGVLSGEEAPVVRVAERGEVVSADVLEGAYGWVDPSTPGSGGGGSGGGGGAGGVPGGWSAKKRRKAVLGLPLPLQREILEPVEAKHRGPALWGLIGRLRLAGVGLETIYRLLTYPEPHLWNKFALEGRAEYLWTHQMTKFDALAVEAARERELVIDGVVAGLSDPVGANAGKGGEADKSGKSGKSGKGKSGKAGKKGKKGGNKGSGKSKDNGKDGFGDDDDDGGVAGFIDSGGKVGWWGGPVPAADCAWLLLKDSKGGKGKRDATWHGLDTGLMLEIVLRCLPGPWVRSGREEDGPRKQEHWFWRADTGCWDPRGDMAVASIVRVLLGGDFTEDVAAKMSGLLWADRPHANFGDMRPAGAVSLPGGRALVLSDLSVRDARPDDYFTFPGGVEWNPAAECPAFDRWMATSAVDCRTEVLEVLGCVAYRGKKPQQVVFLKGGAGSGKTSFYWAAEAIASQGQILDRRFGMLKQDFVWEGAEMANLLFMDDLPEVVDQADVDVLKALSGWAPTPVNRKGRPIVTLRVNAVPVSTCEQVPSFTWSMGMDRRLVVLPFPSSRIPEGDRLDLETAFAGEAEGIFYRAMTALRAMLNREGVIAFTEGEAARAEREAIRGEFDDVGEFLERFIMVGPGERVLRKDVVESFRAWCEERGLPEGAVMGPRAFWPRLADRVMREYGVRSAPLGGRWQSGVRLLRADERTERERAAMANTTTTTGVDAGGFVDDDPGGADAF